VQSRRDSDASAYRAVAAECSITDGGAAGVRLLPFKIKLPLPVLVSAPLQNHAVECSADGVGDGDIENACRCRV